jgi:type I restriction enzyme S subunit
MSQLVKFGDVVLKVNDKVDPQEAGLERYVAGEHMVTDDPFLREFGLVGDGYLGPAFQMRFKPGHILYGSRRTYLRKVAMSSFEGVCANTTFVLRPVNDKLAKEFLLHVMSTERFHTHSILQSKGSVNPYINFSDLVDYEFELPSLDEQARIVELMTAVDEHLDALRSQLEVAKSSRGAVLHQLLTAGGDDWTETTLDAISLNLNSRRIPITKSDRNVGPFPYYGASGIVDYVDNFIFDECTLLISEDGANLTARSTPIAFSAQGKYWVNNHAHVLRFGDIATQTYVEFYLNAVRIDEWVTGAAQPKLNQKSLNEIPIPLPPIAEQKRIVEIVSSMDAVIKATEQAIAEAKVLRTTLLNQEIS